MKVTLYQSTRSTLSSCILGVILQGRFVSIPATVETFRWDPKYTSREYKIKVDLQKNFW